MTKVANAESIMRHIRGAVGRLGWGGLVLAALLGLRPTTPVEGQQPVEAGLPARYEEALKTAHTKLAAVYGAPEQDPTGGHTVAFSADGKLAVSTTGGYLIGDQLEDSTITLWDVDG